MGSNDIPPAHVPSHYVQVCNALLQAGGVLWTLCYVLLTRQSFKDRSYGMPLFALAFNFAWEVIYGVFVAETPLEQTVFSVWMLLDLGMVYGLLLYGKEEWNHAPLIKKHLGKVFVVMVVWCIVAHGTFAKWWIDNDIGKREGKFYRGRVGPDTTELGFWSVLVPQVYLSTASLAQLMTRQHTGGVSWSIWATRTAGSILGFTLNYAWMWYYWREAHEYFLNPFAVLLWSTSLVCDLVYPFVFAHFRGTESISTDGKKVARGVDFTIGKKSL